MLKRIIKYIVSPFIIVAVIIQLIKESLYKKIESRRYKRNQKADVKYITPVRKV
jgi:hypothetical protein